MLPQRNLTVSTYLSQFSQPLPSVHLISFILSQRCNIGALVTACELRLVGPLAGYISGFGAITGLCNCP
jgi:hypothetical protein